MTTLRYGEESFAQWPDNITGIISAEAGRSLIVSNRSGGMLVSNTTPFTIPMTDGVPVSINPLLPAPSAAGQLWIADGNNRATPNYAAVIPGLIIPAGYQKFVAITFNLAVEKLGSGSDGYLFQVDDGGVTIGAGVVHTFGPEPTFFQVTAAIPVALDSGALIGLTVTPQGTSEDITVNDFEQLVQDSQIWSGPV